MASVTIRNLSDDVHRGIKALAARHGHSVEAEMRDILARAVNPDPGRAVGNVLLAIWESVGLTDAEVAAIESSRDHSPAQPIDLNP